MSRNRLWNIHNKYQTQAKKVLCVCSAGLLRSPTAANVIHKKWGFNTRAVGCDKEFALIPVDAVLLAWADEIVCMAQEHKVSIMAEFPFDEIPHLDEEDIVVLNIPDEYEWGDRELKDSILKAYEEHLENERTENSSSSNSIKASV
jgi:predicted protein tyrosine phosphatase